MASPRALRASSSDRVLACPYSLIAPQHILPRREKTAKANEFGTLTHYWVETGQTNMPGADKKDVTALEKKIFMSGIDRQRWWPDEDGNHEVTFAFNAFTMQLVMFRGKRDKADAWKKGKRWDPTRWVTGTIDWVGKRCGRRWIDDLKTGSWPVDVKTSKQLRSYAVALWLLDGAPAIWECDVSITQWARYPLGDEPKREWHVLTGWDCAEHLGDIIWALSNTHVANPVSYGPPQRDEGGQYSFGEKLPHCAGCEAREIAPGISEWITHSFWFRTFPWCFEGIKEMVRRNGTRTLPE